MARKDAIEFRRLPSPRKVLQYAQRRWPIVALKQVRRRLVIKLARQCWSWCLDTYDLTRSKFVRRIAVKVSIRAWRVLHPWDLWPGTPGVGNFDWNLTHARLPDVYVALKIAHASMTIEDRIALARNNKARNIRSLVPDCGLESTNTYH